MTDDPQDELVQRKSDHITAVLGGDVGFGRLTTGFERVQFDHCALPEMSLEEIDLSSQFVGKPLKAPLLISSMTGGPEKAAQINENLGIAAEQLGIALGVGSQRVALETSSGGGLNTSLRQHAPSVPLLGNIGAAQLLGQDAERLVRQAMDMIEADAVFIHLNPLQEAVQRGGDTDWRGVLAAIETLVQAGLPIVVKEVGFGLSAKTIIQLTDIGVTMFDVAGAGGTNWARVEGARDHGASTLTAAFTDWGIPTAQAVMNARQLAPKAEIIASGGISDGVDAAKAIRLGADLVGQAAASLAAAIDSPQAVINHFSAVIDQLRIACFCTGSKNLIDLRAAPLLSGRP